MFRNLCVATVSLILALAFRGPAVAAGLTQAARSAAEAAAPGEAVTLEPIECGWRTSTGAIRAGELFTLVLTCSVVETVSTTVVPDQSRLDPGVLQVPPFEVVRGTQANDLRTGTRRFFQYEYTLRYVGEDFGKDVSVPPLTISYHLQSRVQQDAALEGRERQYILPARVIRILSLVPASAADIRDQPADTFRQIEARRLRANVFRVIAGSLYVVGAFVMMSALVRVFRTRQRHTPAATALASDSAILRRVSEELDEVRRLRANAGWLDALAARALAALRVVAAYAVSHPVTQVRGDGIQPSNGQLVVHGRWPRRHAALISASVTPLTTVVTPSTTVVSGFSRTIRTSGAERLADLDAAMNRFAGKAYGRDAGAINDAELDAALDVGARALDQLRREHTWLAKKRRAMVASLVRLKPDTAGGVARV
jgi:hypothetical protein